MFECGFAAQSRIWLCIILSFTLWGQYLLGRPNQTHSQPQLRKSNKMLSSIQRLQLIFHVNSTYILSGIFCLRPHLPFLLFYPLSVWDYALSCYRDIFRRKLEMKFKDSSGVCYSPLAVLTRELDIFHDEDFACTMDTWR